MDGDATFDTLVRHAADVLHDIKECVASHFDIAVHHSTFQVETAHISDHEQAAVRHP